MKGKQWINREAQDIVPICINVPRHSFFNGICHNVPF